MRTTHAGAEACVSFFVQTNRCGVCVEACQRYSSGGAPAMNTCMRGTSASARSSASSSVAAVSAASFSLISFSCQDTGEPALGERKRIICRFLCNKTPMSCVVVNSPWRYAACDLPSADKVGSFSKHFAKHSSANVFNSVNRTSSAARGTNQPASRMASPSVLGLLSARVHRSRKPCPLRRALIDTIALNR